VFYANAKMTQERTYSVFDRAFIEINRTAAPDIDDDLAVMLGGPHHNCHRADTIEDLAVQAGIDPRALQATLAHYNDLCATGTDEDFAKRADRMIPINTPPYYIVRQDLAVWTTIGAIRTNRRFEAVDAKGRPVRGLYAAGVDGCELYRNSYSLNVPGSCNAGNIHSGRVAAKSAFDYLRG
jgi:fumarate reductase flavoprotein subunit